MTYRTYADAANDEVTLERLIAAHDAYFEAMDQAVAKLRSNNARLDLVDYFKTDDAAFDQQVRAYLQDATEAADRLHDGSPQDDEATRQIRVGE